MSPEKFESQNTTSQKEKSEARVTSAMESLSSEDNLLAKNNLDNEERITSAMEALSSEKEKSPEDQNKQLIKNFADKMNSLIQSYLKKYPDMTEVYASSSKDNMQSGIRYQLPNGGEKIEIKMSQGSSGAFMEIRKEFEDKKTKYMLRIDGDENISLETYEEPKLSTLEKIKETMLTANLINNEKRTSQSKIENTEELQHILNNFEKRFNEAKNSLWNKSQFIQKTQDSYAANKILEDLDKVV